MKCNLWRTVAVEYESLKANMQSYLSENRHGELVSDRKNYNGSDVIVYEGKINGKNLLFDKNGILI